MDQALFVVFGGLALAASVMAITRKNAVAAAVWLVGMFFGLAGAFVLLEAYFVAVIQILVYAGAIMVLFLFVIMLLDLRRDDLLAAGRPRLKLPGVVLSALFLVVVAKAILDAKTPGVVAPRASARLLLAPPAGAASDDPLAEPASPPPAPEPVRVALSRREPAALPIDDALRETLSRRSSGGGPDAWGESKRTGPRPRVFAGSLRGSGPPAKDRTVVVALDRSLSGEVYADVDGDGTVGLGEAIGRVLASSDPATGPQGRMPADFVAPGAVLEVDVQPSGLGAAPGGAPDGSPFAIGKSLFDDWILPFEVTSLLLLGAIFGVVVLTKRRLA
jgi:NADH:ubiquinone oxidoreductase subunit 6 (subunit J)